MKKSEQLQVKLQIALQNYGREVLNSTKGIKSKINPITGNTNVTDYRWEIEILDKQIPFWKAQEANPRSFVNR